MLDKLPKDILSLLLSYVEHDYKKKFVDLKKEFKMLHNVSGLTLFTCSDKSCDDLFYANYLYCNDAARVVTSQNVKMKISMSSKCRFRLNEKLVSVCTRCETWSCVKHCADKTIEHKTKDKVSHELRTIYDVHPEIFMDCDRDISSLSRNMLIQSICQQNYYKNKHLKLQKLFTLLNTLGEKRFEKYECAQSFLYQSPKDVCNNICYIYHHGYDDNESGESIISVSNVDGVDNPIRLPAERENEESICKYGVYCPNCNFWICKDHWKKNVYNDDYTHFTNEIMELFICNKCNDHEFW